MDKLTVVKVGGNLIDNTAKLESFLEVFSKIKGKTLLVHGGGKLATNLASKLGLETKMINGRRITDAENLKLVIMVYAGYINKSITASLQAKGKNAIGICGCDLNILKAKKRQHTTIEYGFVGDVTDVNTNALSSLINSNNLVVIAPITHDKKGQLLNTNADSIATDIAVALSDIYHVKLIYSFEKTGVLYNVDNESDIIAELTEGKIKEMQKTGTINTGMLPKTDNALKAIRAGVNEVVIGNLEAIQNGISEGTRVLQ